MGEALRLIDESLEIATRYKLPNYSHNWNVLYLQGKAQLGIRCPENFAHVSGTDFLHDRVVRNGLATMGLYEVREKAVGNHVSLD